MASWLARLFRRIFGGAKPVEAVEPQGAGADVTRPEVDEPLPIEEPIKPKLTPSAACTDLIKRFEGCRLKAYVCPAGLWTIGYGHTEGISQGDEITQEIAEQLLAEDVLEFSAGVLAAVRVPLSQSQLDALVSLAYNVGVGAFGRSTLLLKLNAGDTQAAAAQFDRWVFSKGKRLPGLVARRAAERKVFVT